MTVPEMPAIGTSALERERVVELYRYPPEMKAMLERPVPTPVDVTIDAPPTGRQVLFFMLSGLTMAGMIWLATYALSAGGFGLTDLLLVVLFALTLPWLVIGFWNASIGFLIMRFARDPVAAVTPAAGRITGREPIVSSTAILVCIRNEPPERVIRHIAPMIDGLVARDVAQQFHLYVLSDTSDLAHAAIESRQFAELANAWRGRIELTYRRREVNTGFKAGNIRDFCDRWGHSHDFALTLDADSLMTADAVLRLVRVMQASPRLGILQSLVIGMPSTSTFARIFQFGMRLGMRSYTIGSAWWQGDCGPYWGHNALIRLAPFMAHCHLPILGKGALIPGHVLSHDQVEAVLIRRAGYEVRVLAEEGDSFEQNPPTLIEFIQRDFRWCQGNMQYWHFLLMPGIKWVSRYQLAFALVMFLGSPGWIGLLALGSIAVALAGSGQEFVYPGTGLLLYALVLLTWFAPKIATVIDVLLRAKLRKRFGGGIRFSAGVVTEVIFFLMLSPIMWFAHTLFLARLVAGRSIGWGVQARDDHRVPWSHAARQLWPHTLLGASTVSLLALTVPGAIPYALFVAGGLLLSIPYAVITASPMLGRALVRIGLCRLPEEMAPPREMAALELPAVVLAAGQTRVTLSEQWRTLRGVLRSLRIYYGNRARRPDMDRLYRPFVKPGDLVFDVGAHVGDRIASFRRLGARVVAVEPQPALARTLKLLYGRDRCVAIEPVAIGRSAGTIALKVNLDNPTVSSASDAFIKAADGAPGWEGQRWNKTVHVPVTTLDILIDRHGLPSFIKVDVEGFEVEAIAGLTRDVPALSFEFTTIQRELATAGIERCTALGYRLFNAALGESQALVHSSWQDAQAIAAWLAALPMVANSGDIYALRIAPAADPGS
jgi:membrane glycosyltransferase